MRKEITRSFTVTTIKSANVTFEKGKAVVTPNADITLMGNISADSATIKARKTYGINASVTSIESREDTYVISVEDFLKYAKKVEPKQEEKADADNKEKNNADKS